MLNVCVTRVPSPTLGVCYCCNIVVLIAYEKKYGTEAEREARRETQALARVKAMAEREKLERDEQKQLTEVIMASLAEVRRVWCHGMPNSTNGKVDFLFFSSKLQATFGEGNVKYRYIHT